MVGRVKSSQRVAATDELHPAQAPARATKVTGNRSDRFSVGGSTQASDALARLSGGVAPSHQLPQLRLGIGQTKPLLNLQPKFTIPKQSDEGPAGPNEIAGIAVTKGRRMHFEGVKNDFLHPSALTTVDLQFGKISRAQFDTLHETFGARSDVVYAPDREFAVVDFLPPALQALVNRNIDLPESVTLAGTQHWDSLPLDKDKTVGLSNNCHGIAYEAVQAFLQPKTDVAIFNGDAMIMDGIAYDLAVVHELSADRGADLADLPLVPGDLVQVLDPNARGHTDLLHSSVYVGGGLFFEKPDTESEDSESPYRLTDAEGLRSPVEHFVDGPVGIRVHRAKDELPPAESRFKSEMSDAADKLADVSGRPLGNALMTNIEFGMGGGLIGEYVTALARMPLARDPAGRGTFA